MRDAEARQPAPRMPQGPVKKLLFGLAVTAVTFGLLEGATRLVLDDPPAAALWIDTRRDELASWMPEQTEGFVGDPYLAWRNRPGHERSRAGGKVSINRFGLRNGPMSRRKPPGVYRILSLGESSAFGVRVGQDETFAAVLERCLRSRHGEETRYQVLNAAVVGYSLVQSWLYLEREGLGFEPDAVLLYHGFNDYLSAGHLNARTAIPSEGLRGRTDLQLMGSSLRLWNRLDALLFSVSRAYRWVTYALRSREAPEPPPGSGAEGEGGTKRLTRVPDSDRREVLRSFLRLSREHSFDLVVLVPPYRRFAKHREVLLEFAEDSGVRAVDLEEAVDSLGVPRETLFFDPVHPTALLHRAMGEAVCDALVENLSRAGAAAGGASGF